MKALIAMSGGVDSSVAAYLMMQAGYDCLGATMRLYDSQDQAAGSRTCCTLADAEDARSVAHRLGMPYYVFNFTGDFQQQVMDRFVRAYETGATPNPCIDCNRYLKFDRLHRRALELGCDCLATGHYARLEFDRAAGRWILKKALDPDRDQSYVLYAMTQDQLAHTRFPLGELTKPQVRQIARAQGFLNAGKPDSQDICFVPDGDYPAFIRRYTGKDYPPGAFVDLQGKPLGRHRGVIHYTIGQRRGLGVSAEHPLYVQAIDPETNTVTLTEQDGLYTRTLLARDLNWIAVPGLDKPTRCRAKIRYRQSEQPATAVLLDKTTLELRFDTPQRAVTPGQAVVLYQGEVVLGGGTIQQAKQA